MSLTSLRTAIVFDLLSQLKSGDLLVVDSRKRSGLIIFKPFHAEFAGPGAAIGSVFDQDCVSVLPVGDFSAVPLATLEDRQKAYLIRRQWIRLVQQITDNPDANERIRMLLNQFNNYFDWATVAQISDEAFALMVGVLPQTVKTVRASLTE